MRKGKTLLALLLALAMTVSALGDSQLFVLAEGGTAEEGASPGTEEIEEPVEEAAEEKPAAEEPEVPAEEPETPVEEQPESPAEEPAETPAEEQPAEEQPAEQPESEEPAKEQPAEEQPAEQPEGEETAKEQPVEEQPNGEEPAEAPETPAEEQPTETVEEPAAPAETPAEEQPAEVPAAEVPVAEQPAEETEAELSTEPLEFEEELDGVRVKAYAEAGIFPEDAVMSVTAVTEEDEAYGETEAALQEDSIAYDGFLAYDISFFDKDGEKQEPEAGTVKVSVEIAADQFPGGIDIESFAVQHLAELEDGIQVETVADAAEKTDGTMELTEDSVIAEFQVESFSTFAVTWSEDTEIYLSGVETSAAPKVDKPLSREKYVEYNEASDTYDLNLTVSGAIASQNEKIPMDVLLIVDKSGSMADGMSGQENPGQGNRRIDAVANATKQLTDALSRNENLDVRYSIVTFNGPTKFKVKGSSENAQLALDWTISTDPVTNANAVNNMIGKIRPDGGTNYQAGINKGIIQIGLAREGAQRIVIFLTDGVPTVRNNVGSCHDYEDEKVKENNTAAVNTVKGMHVNAFYCIGAGSAFSNSNSLAMNNLNDIKNAVDASEKAVYSATNTTELENAFKAIIGNTTTILCDHVTITDTLSENVTPVLNADGALKKLNITVTDGDGKQIASGRETVSLAKTEKNEAAVLRAVYTDGQLQLQFPSNYKLEQNWTYRLTIEIKATKEAYENYHDAGDAYPNTGEARTGVTSAGQGGLYSNVKDTAKVLYEFNGEKKEAPYNMPVIQIHPKQLTISKKVSGITEEQAKNLEFTMKITASDSLLKGTYPIAGSKETVAFTNGTATVKLTGTGTITIKNLPLRTYTVEEQTNAMADVQELYYWDHEAYTENKSAELTMSKNGAVTVTNYYKPYRSLQVVKKVEGEMGDQNQTFKFEVKKNDMLLEKGTYGNIAVTNGTFGLKSGQSISISKLKENDKISVTEIDGNTGGYRTSYTINDSKDRTSGTSWSSTDNLPEGTTKITFINTKDRVIPTGIQVNWMPFSRMLLAGVGMALVMLFTGKRRKI